MCTDHTAGAVQHRTSDHALSRRAALATGVAAATTVALAGTAAAGGPASTALGRGARRGLVDLTHPFTTTFPTFTDGEEPSRATVVTIEEDGSYLQEWRLFEHNGTHVDAPGHFAPGGRLATDLVLEELVVPAVVIDIAARAAQDPDTVVTVDDVRALERRDGRIPPGAAVLMHSGWAARAGDRQAYRGTDPDGVLHFPGFGAEATEWLLRHRQIRGLGVDTLSTDPGTSEAFETHVLLAAADRYGVENLAHLDQLPPRGATLVVGIIPFEEGSGGPARVFAAV